MCLNLNGKLQEAFKAYEKAIELDPRNWQAYVGLGSIHMKNDQTAKAIHAFRKAAEFKSDDYTVYYNLGEGIGVRSQHLT